MWGYSRRLQVFYVIPGSGVVRHMPHSDIIIHIFFRMNVRGGVYGDSPFTLQTGGCGEQGEFIQVSKHLLALLQYTLT